MIKRCADFGLEQCEGCLDRTPYCAFDEWVEWISRGDIKTRIIEGLQECGKYPNSSFVPFFHAAVNHFYPEYADYLNKMMLHHMMCKDIGSPLCYSCASDQPTMAGCTVRYWTKRFSGSDAKEVILRHIKFNSSANEAEILQRIHAVIKHYFPQHLSFFDKAMLLI